MDGFDIDRLIQRLANTLVLERVLAFDVRIEELVAILIHADEHDAIFNALDHFDVRCLLQPRNVLRRRIVDEIDLAGNERGEARRVGIDRREHDLVDVAVGQARLDPPPVRVLDEHRFDVGLARLQHIRAGSIRLPRGNHVLLLREVLRLGGAVLLAPGLAHDIDRSDML